MIMRLFSPSRVRNIFICIDVVFCASSRMMAALVSVRPRMKASGAISISPVCKRAFDDPRIHQIVQRVVDRPQIGIDFLAQIAGQKAEPLAGFDRGPRQDDAIDFLALEQLGGMRHREPGLAGAGRADAEHQFVAFERADIGILRGGAGPHRALAQIDALELRFCGLGVELEQRALRDHRADRAFDIALRQIVALGCLRIQGFQHAPRGVAAVARAGDSDVIAAGVHDDSEPALDQRQVLSVGADQRRRRAVVVEIDDDLCLGRDLHVAVKFAAGSE